MKKPRQEVALFFLVLDAALGAAAETATATPVQPNGIDPQTGLTRQTV